MFVVCVSNHKGGVGKTTTAVSLAACLARRGHRVVAVGLDPQGNLSMGLGVRPSTEQPTTFDLLRGKVHARAATQRVPHPGLELLRVVPAGRRLFRAEGWLFNQMGFEDLLKQRLAPLAKTNDFAILDCGPSLGALTMTALCYANLVLVPVQCEAFSLQGVESLLELVTMMRRRNPGLQVHLLPTLFDQRNRICRDVLAQMQSDFKGKMAKAVIGVDTKVRDSQARRTPLCLHAPKSRANLAYEDLAREILGLAHRRPKTKAKRVQAA